MEEFSRKKHFLNKLFENFPINININKSKYVEITILGIKKLLNNIIKVARIYIPYEN